MQLFLLDSRIPHNALAVHCSRGNDGRGRTNNKNLSYLRHCEPLAAWQSRKISTLTMFVISNYMYSVIPAQAGIQTTCYCESQSDEAMK
jgi:hypothetical protein